MDRIPASRVATVTLTGFMIVLTFSVSTIWSLDRWPLMATQLAVVALAILASFRATILSGGWPGTWLPVPFLLASFCGVAQLAVGSTVYPFATEAATLDWLTLAMASFVAGQVFRDPDLVMRFRRFAAWFGGIIALWAILQDFSAHGRVLWILATPESDRPMGPFLSYDYYCTFIELLFPIAAWDAFTTSRKDIARGVLAALMYASVIVAASRTGFV